VFDSLIIAAGIVGYDTAKILGIYIGTAPIEDFMYALLAAVIVPALWKGFGLYDRKS
jgi:lycopene cyclase domain-containing protein